MTNQLKIVGPTADCRQLLVSPTITRPSKRTIYRHFMTPFLLGFALIPIEKRQDHWVSFVIALTPTQSLQFLLMTLSLKCQTQCWIFDSSLRRCLWLAVCLGWFGIEVLHWTSQIKFQNSATSKRQIDIRSHFKSKCLIQSDTALIYFHCPGHFNPTKVDSLMVAKKKTALIW